MSLSAGTTANTDLDAIVTGGDAFMARLKEFKDAKAESEAALANLRLGTDVVRAMQDVQTREQAALDALATAKEEADKIGTEARAEADSILAAANEQAEEIKSQARAAADDLSREVDEARTTLNDWSAKTRADANALMDSAVSAKAVADQRVKDADQKAAAAGELMERAKAAEAAAAAQTAAVSDWLNELNAVAARLNTKMDGSPSLPG